MVAVRLIQADIKPVDYMIGEMRWIWRPCEKSRLDYFKEGFTYDN